MCWCRFWKQVPAGSGEFRCVAGVGSGRFRRVPVCAGVGSAEGCRVRKVPESCGVVCCFAILSGAAMGLF